MVSRKVLEIGNNEISVPSDRRKCLNWLTVFLNIKTSAGQASECDYKIPPGMRSKTKFTLVKRSNSV